MIAHKGSILRLIADVIRQDPEQPWGDAKRESWVQLATYARDELDEMGAALGDVSKRHERVHDSADSYQIRAIAAEAREQRLLARIARVDGVAGNLQEAADVIGDDAISDLAKACRDTLRQAATDLEEALKGGEP